MPRPQLRPDAAVAPPKGARTATQFDTTSDAARAAALNAPAAAGERMLGRAVVSLGNPAIAGLWLETPLVNAVTPGRVVYPATGNSVSLELRPLSTAGAVGSRISLAAMRLLGVPLTALPEVIVYAE